MFYSKGPAQLKFELNHDNLLHYLKTMSESSIKVPINILMSGLRNNQTHELQTPLTINVQPNGTILRNFIALRFKYDDPSDLPTINQAALNFIDTLDNTDYGIYVDNYNSFYNIIIPINKYLSKQPYRKLLKTLLETEELKPIKDFVPKSEYSITPLLVPFDPISKYSKWNIHDNMQIEPTLLVNDYIDDQSQTLQHSTVTQYDTDKLQNALSDFIKSHDIPSFVSQPTKIKGLVDAVITSFLRSLINQDFVELVIRSLIEKAPNKQDILVKRVNDSYEALMADAALQTQAPPLSDYFPLYRQGHQTAKTLSQQFLDTLPPDLNPDPDMDLSTAGDLVKNIYPPALIDRPGKQRDNVAIFNPLTGIWSHDDDIFLNLVNAIRPYTKKGELDTIISTFASEAANQQRIFKPYSGSRYLIFRNGVLDIITMEFHDLDENFVRDLHFIERHQLDIDYVDNPPMPHLKDEKVAGGDWTPLDFIRAYADNDDHKLQYFLFGMSLGLFGGHNFGVHFSIQGQSRWGKSSLAEIYKGLYNNRIEMIPFTALNGRFPFTSYHANNSLIWVNECNEETEPLNDERGTIIYDGLADNQVRFEVKGTDDIVLSNPPQVYIDGTSLVKATDMSTGPAGRTLAYCLPTMTDDLRNQAYAINIADDLHDVQVLQWLLYQMIQAYRATVPQKRQADLRLNLNLKSDLAMLPNFAIEWRKKLGSGNADLANWFNEQIVPYLNNTTDPHHGTYMHNQVLFTLYRQHYADINPQDRRNFTHMMPFEQFDKQITKVINNSNWEIYRETSRNHQPMRHRFTTLNALKFDWRERDKDYDRPFDYRDPNDLPYPFKTKNADWFQLYKSDN